MDFFLSRHLRQRERVFLAAPWRKFRQDLRHENLRFQAKKMNHMI